MPTRLLHTLVLPAVLTASLGTAEQAHTLSFDERVRAQEAIERVYYSHQIGATARFEDAMPRAVLERRVRSYLRESVALDRLWGTPVTEAMLLGEQARILRDTRFADRLEEIFAALDNDLFRFQECFIRSVLTNRLAQSFFAMDARLHDASRRSAVELRRSLTIDGVDPAQPDERRQVYVIVKDERVTRSQGLPRSEAATSLLGAIRIEATQREFTEWGAEFASMQPGKPGSLIEKPDAFEFSVLLRREPRLLLVARYRIPKQTWEVWWEESGAEFDPKSVEDIISARQPPIDPNHNAAHATRLSLPSSPTRHWLIDPATCDKWVNGSLDDPPEGRTGHTSVWTGNVMIVWGGNVVTPNNNVKELNTGGRYDPMTDTWSPVSLMNAPQARANHSAIWTGTEMIVWGGGTFPAYLQTGGRYDPRSDTWVPTVLGGAPAGRRNHTAIWTGMEMIVWGGQSGSGYTTTGGRYRPSTDSWSPTNAPLQPAGRERHTAVWTGTYMLVWGGYDGSTQVGTGGRYDPATDIWTLISSVSAPVARFGHTAVWTGSEMVIWGGWNGSYLNDGRLYNPSNNSWSFVTQNVTTPPGRAFHSAAWTGSEMIVWGGQSTVPTQTGGRFDPATNAWLPTSTTNAPAVRSNHTAVWTGTYMLVWGGTLSGLSTDTGARYAPATNTWTPISRGQAPDSRGGQSTVWTGTHMIIWGGLDALAYKNDGWRYDPVIDGWSQISTTNAPSARTRQSVVWSGQSMIIWGGMGQAFNTYQDTGGRYDPVADSWTPTTRTNAPSPRIGHTAVWAQGVMIVWGGAEFPTNAVRTGGLYDPLTDTWSSVSLTGAPSPRSNAMALAAGSSMIIWGGATPPDGFRYWPASNTWAPLATIDQPSERVGSTAVWTGQFMIIWGGYLNSFHLNSGGLYDPVTDSWRPLSTVNAPSPRSDPRAVWADGMMIVWGGIGGGDTPLNTGGQYAPSTDSWEPTSLVGAATPRTDFSMIWTGNAMLVWGGFRPSNNYLRSGGSLLFIQPGDGDGDGFDVCGGDCDDSNPAMYPGAPQVCGDHAGNDCLHPYWPSTAGTNEADEDGDTFSECLGECDDADPLRYPRAPEINDGLDNQCPGDPGFGLADEIDEIGFVDVGFPNRLCWTAQDGAQDYLVSRADSTDFTTGCQLFRTGSATCEDDTTDPLPGRVFYYLVRADAPHVGSWGRDSSGVEREAACDPHTRVLTFVDSLNDDLAGAALRDFFLTTSPSPSGYIYFEIAGGSTGGAWCSQQADFYRDSYLAYATTSATIWSGTWNKWYRLGSGSWTGPVQSSQINYIGTDCYENWSWCPEYGIGGLLMDVRPAGPPFCELTDDNYGCGGGTWSFTLRVSDDRFEACRF